MSKERNCWATMFNALPSRDVIGGSGLVLIGAVTLWLNHSLDLGSFDMTSWFFIWGGMNIARGAGPHRFPR